MKKPNFKLNTHFLFLFAALAAPTAYGSVVTIPTQPQCVPAPVSSVVNAITNYENYSKIPESTYSIGILGLQKTVMQMTQSHINAKLVSSSNNDAIITIQLRPMNLNDPGLYPNFRIRCKVTSETATSAHHECHALTPGDLDEYGLQNITQAPFGVSHFDSDLQIEANSPNCPANQTQLTYTLVVESKDADVEKILDASPYAEIKTILPQNDFFKLYYQHFYNGWVKTIQ